MNKLVTPSRFKIIVIVWTVLGQFFVAGFLFGAVLITKDMFEANFKFTTFPIIALSGIALSLVLPLVFIIYYYSRSTLRPGAIVLLKCLFIISFPLLIYVWIIILPDMSATDIFYEMAFFILHLIVFLNFPGYFNELRSRLHLSNKSAPGT